MRRHPNLPWLPFLVWFLLLTDPVWGDRDPFSRLARLEAELVIAPNDAALLLERAELHRLRGDWDRALADCERARKVAPESMDADLVRASFLFQTGNYLEALEALNSFLGANPDHARGLLLRGRTLVELNRAREAATDFLSVLSESLSPTIVLECVEALAETGEAGIAEALDCLDEGLDRLGPLVAFHSKAVELELERGNASGALARLESLLAEVHRKEKWLLRKGEILLELGEEGLAEEALEAALVAIRKLPARHRRTRLTTRILETAEGRLETLSSRGNKLPRYQSATSPSDTESTPVDVARIAREFTPSRRNRVHPPLLKLATPTAVTRGPYLQTGSPSAITVRWRTNNPVPSGVSYGPAPNDLSFSVSEATPTVEHELRVTGLTPDTRYYYGITADASAVLAGADADHFFRTSPVPGTAKPVRVWVLGDSGTADAKARAVREAFNSFAGPNRPDLWLMLGDNAYWNGTDEEYQTAVFETYPEILKNAVLWPTLGNHDGFTADSATQSGPYYDVFSLPKKGEAGGLPSGTEAYYSFDYADIHFICLESYWLDRDPSGPMLTWLAADIADTTREWIVAFWHHPPYSKGSHDSDSEGGMVEMRENAVPILEEGGVDLVLTGHSHSYERSFFLDGHYGLSETLAEAMVVDGGNGRSAGDGVYLKTDAPGSGLYRGAVYAVAGSSGKTTHGALDHPAMFYSVETLGSFVIDVDGSRLDAGFVDATGSLRDFFTIVHEKVPPPSETTHWVLYE